MNIGQRFALSLVWTAWALSVVVLLEVLGVLP